MTRSRHLCLGLIVSILVWFPSSALPGDEEGRIDADWHAIEGEYFYRILFAPPPNASPRLAGVVCEDEAGNVTEADCILRAEESRIAFPRGYNATVRLKFTEGEGDSLKEWFSDPFSVSDGAITHASGGAAPEVLAQVANPGGVEREHIDVTFAEGIATISDPPDGLSYKWLEYDDPVSDSIRVFDRNNPAFDLEDGILTPNQFFEAGEGRLRSPTPLRLVFSDGTREYESDEFDYNNLAATDSDIPGDDAEEEEEEEEEDSEIELFAGGASRVLLHRQLKGSVLPGVDDFKALVVDSASKYEFHPTAGAFVFRYDHRPYETAAKIAKILRETAEELDADTTVEEETEIMNAKFATFYASGENPFSTHNPYVDDWQPYLKELRDEVTADVGKLQVDNEKTLWKFVLVGLADGFDEVAKLIEGTISGDEPVAFGASSGGVSGATTGTSGERRRISCWNLLFGL